MRASNWQKEDVELDGWAVQLRSYAINDQYLAEVEVVSSGVTIARATETIRAEAERQALAKALQRLQASRQTPSGLMVGG